MRTVTRGWLALALSCLLACSQPAAIATQVTSAAQLERNLRLAAGLEVFVDLPDGSPIAARVQRELSALAESQDCEVTWRKEWQGGGIWPRLVVLDRATCERQGEALLPLLQSLESMGFAWLEGAGFQFGGRLYGSGTGSQGRDALIATFEDPERPGLPINLALAERAESALACLQSWQPCARPGFACYRKGMLERYGALNADGSSDGQQLTRYPALVRAEELTGHQGKDRRKSWGSFSFRFPGTLTSAEIESWLEHLQESGALQRMELASSNAKQLLGTASSQDSSNSEEPNKRRLITLYAGAESKARAVGDWSVASADPIDFRVHALVSNGTGVSDLAFGGQLAVALARAELMELEGEPHWPWLLDAASVAWGQSWWERDLLSWQAHLLRADLPTDPASLLGLGARAGWWKPASEHWRVPMQAGLWQFLEESQGFDYLRELWLGEHSFEELLAFEFEFSAWLKARVASDAVVKPERQALPTFVQGAELQVDDAFERYFERDWLEGGFGTEAFRKAYFPASATESTDSDWVKERRLVSFTTHRFLDPGLPQLWGQLPGRNLQDPASLFAALRQAEDSGVARLLKPNFMDNRSTTWSLWMPLGTEAAWELAFDDFEQDLVHTAMLAELAGVEVLCLASGLRTAADTWRERPGRLARELEFCDLRLRRWRQLIDRVRSVYSGQLTYAAGGVAELKNVRFWDQLDFVSMDLREPVCDQGEVNRRLPVRELKHFLEASLSRLRGVCVAERKPGLLLDVGLPLNMHSAADPRWSSLEVDPAFQSDFASALGKSLGDLVEQANPENEVFQGPWLRGALLGTEWAESGVELVLTTSTNSAEPSGSASD